MGYRIKVTGFIDPDDLDPADVDLNSPTGLSDGAYDVMASNLDLDELEFELLEDENIDA